MDQEILQMLHLTFNNAIEAADTERRMISGKIAPYGEVGYTSAGPVVFERGSIAIPDVTKIKLLMQHDSTKPVGRATYSSDDESGVYASFKISSSSRGQDALVLAQENLVSGLSVGVDVSASKQMKGYLLVTAAVLKEVSLVESAAFDSAAVTDIAAAKAALEATQTKNITSSNDTESETETESEAAVTTAPIDTPDVPAEKPVEAAPVEAARPIIRPSVLDSQTVRTPITSMAKYTEHKIKAALGNQDSMLYITAADDDFSTNPAFSPTQYLSEFPTNTRFGTPSIDACSRGVLPASGMTINVPSLVTSAGGQSGTAPTVTVEAEGGAVANTGMVTEYLSGTVPSIQA
jgi:HK97 family phage prohead protease